jgi:hypothetical protein
MKCVKLRDPSGGGRRQVQTGLVPRGEGGLQVAVRWWILMTGLLAWVSGRCEATVLFLFLAVYYYFI